MNLKVSLITVCYNCEVTIFDTLNSIALQTYRNIEYIVIDGGSTDRTIDILNSSPIRISKLISERDNGIYSAMNKGLNLVTGDLVGFLNADDVFDNPSVLENIVHSFSDAEIDCCYSDLVYVDPISNNIKRLFKSSIYYQDSFLQGWFPPHPTLYFRSKFIKNGIRFNESFKIASDVDFMIRLFLLLGVRAKYIPRIHVRMKTGGISNSSIKNIIIQNLEILRSFKEIGIKINICKFFFYKILNRVAQIRNKKNAI